MKKTSEFPSGWDERRVREILDHYENQTDEEAAAEHEAALSSPEHTVTEVPAEQELVARQAPVEAPEDRADIEDAREALREAREKGTTSLADLIDEIEGGIDEFSREAARQVLKRVEW
jgi:hypothetical protein